MAGKRNERLAFERSSGSADEFCALSPSELSRVEGGESFAAQKVRQYETIVFVGGWGSSMYQYDFPGDY